MAANNSQEGSIEVVLSRPAYRLGSNVVGTIRLLPKDDHIDPRAWLDSARVYVAGRCRIDSRWHNPVTYQRIYGIHPHLKELSSKERATEGDNTVCFWATNAVSLLELEERTVGQWKDVEPVAQTEDLARECEAAAYQEHNDLSRTTRPPLETQQLAFTFRAHLPRDIPPSAVATCCRYFYSVVVSVTTTSGNVLLVNAPFSVLAGTVEHHQEDAPRVRLGTCSAMAHSAGLPSHVTATDHAKGATTVNRNLSLQATLTANNVQTMRIADPSGEPCCILTAIGIKVLYPGSLLLLQFDFTSDTKCRQVSACLQGQEVALYEDGSSRKTRSWISDTDHEQVEANCTERLELKLHLPLDSPCTLHTDLVQISHSCRIDICVEKDAGGGYTNLQLNLPCPVVHAPTAADDQHDLDEDATTPIDELIFGSEALSMVETDSTKPSSFQTRDIRKDLKVLSLQMVEACGLET